MSASTTNNHNNHTLIEVDDYEHEKSHAPLLTRFRAKELIGGIEYWRKEGGAVEGTRGNDAAMCWSMGA